jgi:hypothetical protein
VDPVLKEEEEEAMEWWPDGRGPWRACGAGLDPRPGPEGAQHILTSNLTDLNRLRRIMNTNGTLFYSLSHLRLHWHCAQRPEDNFLLYFSIYYLCF